MAQIPEDAEIQVELVVYANGEKVMAYGVLDAWPNTTRGPVPATRRIWEAGDTVWKSFTESFPEDG
jgi:hypothetical protein